MTNLDIGVCVAAIATPIVIALGFLFTYRQWQSIRNSRMAEVVISIMRIWDSPEMAESRCKVNASGLNLKKDYETADKANTIDAYASLIRVINFFDGLGVLVAEGLLDSDIAYDLLGKAEKTYYRLYEPMITAREFEDYTPYFLRLHKSFINEEARRSKVKKQRAS
jgi:hypothetical protein